VKSKVVELIARQNSIALLMAIRSHCRALFTSSLVEAIYREEDPLNLVIAC
jgi:hypothetical protein